MVGQKNAMPYDYPPQMANSSWLSDQGQKIDSFQKNSQKAEPIIHNNANLPQSNFIKSHFKTYIHNIDT